MAPPAPTPGQQVWPVIALLALAGLACVNAFPAEFTLDSAPIIANHPLLVEGSPWWRLFLKTYWGDTNTAGLYRPVTMLTYWVERRIFGVTSPWPHALFNAALHAACVLLLRRLALRWTRCGKAAFAAAALFAVHPVLSEVVPNLVGRADLIAALGVLAALLCWERALFSGRAWPWVTAAAAAWAVGLLAKESAVVFPAIAFLRAVWWRSERHPREPSDKPRAFRHPFLAVAHTLRSWWLAFAGLTLLLAAWWAVHTLVSRTAPPLWLSALGNPLVEAGAAERLMTAAVVLMRYFGTAIFPLWMAADHSAMDVPIVTSPAAPAFGAAAAGLLAYAGLTLWLCRVRPAAAMGLAFAALAILPVANVFFPIGTVMAERLLYLPLAGVALAAGVAAEAAWSAARRRGRGATFAAAAAFALILLALTARTWQRNAIWDTRESLWRATAEDAPLNHKPPLALAHLDLARGDATAAVAEVERALQLASPVSLGYRAEMLLDASRIHLARARGLAADPAAAAPHRERALQLADLGLRAYETEPRRSFQLALAAAFERQGRPMPVDEGIVQLQRARAEALYGLRRYPEAADAIDAALARRPGDAELVAALERIRARAAGPD